MNFGNGDNTTTSITAEIANKLQSNMQYDRPKSQQQREFKIPLEKLSSKVAPLNTHRPTSRPKSTFRTSRKKRDGRPKLSEVILYFMFMIVFLGVTIGAGRGEDAYWFSDKIQDLLIHEPFDFTDTQFRRDFQDISKMTDFWFWLQGPFMEGVYPYEWYNGRELTPNETPFVLATHRLIGSVRLRQKRVRKNACTVLPMYRELISECFPAFHPSTEDHTPFGPHGIYTYSPPEGLSDTYFALISSFTGGGYIFDLSPNRTIALQEIEELKNNEWIDLQTRAVMVDLTLYDANINYFCVVRMIVEFPPSAGGVPSSTFRIVRLFPYVTAGDYARLAFELVIVVFVFYYIYDEVLEIRDRKWDYFKDRWNYVDWLNLLIFLTVFAMRGVEVIYSNMSHFGLDSQDFTSAHALAFLIDMERCITAVNAFICWFKIFKYIRINQRLSQLTDTLSRAAADIFVFLFIFTIVFFGYAQAAWMLFSVDIISFRSIPQSIYALFRQLLGDSDFEAMVNSNRWLGPLFFFSYSILVFFVLMNMFLAIINESYVEVKNKAKKDSSTSLKTFFTHAFSNAKSLILKDRSEVKEIRAAIEQKKEAHGGMDREDVQRVVKEHEKAMGTALGSTDADTIIKKYDKDGNHILDEKETNQLLTFLKNEERNLDISLKHLEHHQNSQQSQYQQTPSVPPLHIPSQTFSNGNYNGNNTIINNNNNNNNSNSINSNNLQTSVLLPPHASPAKLPTNPLSPSSNTTELASILTAIQNLSSHFDNVESKILERMEQIETKIEEIDKKVDLTHALVNHEQEQFEEDDEEGEQEAEQEEDSWTGSQDIALDDETSRDNTVLGALTRRTGVPLTSIAHMLNKKIGYQ